MDETEKLKADAEYLRQVNSLDFSKTPIGEPTPRRASGRDPMREDDWTLAMLAAWVIWRTTAEVRRHWHVCRGDPTTMGYVLSLEWITGRMVDLPDYVPAVLRAEPARDEIEHALINGQVPVYGVVRGEILPKALPPGLWHTVPIEIRGHLLSRDEYKWHDAVFRKADPEPVATGVFVRREDVMRIWPPLDAAGEPAIAKVEAPEIERSGAAVVMPADCGAGDILGRAIAIAEVMEGQLDYKSFHERLKQALAPHLVKHKTSRDAYQRYPGKRARGQRGPGKAQMK